MNVCVKPETDSWIQKINEWSPVGRLRPEEDYSGLRLTNYNVQDKQPLHWEYTAYSQRFSLARQTWNSRKTHLF